MLDKKLVTSLAYGVKLIVDCCDYLEKFLKEEGIFRENGGKKDIETLLHAFINGEEPDLDAVSDHNVVAGVVKLYLQNLPQPLLTRLLADEFVKCGSASEPSIDAVRGAVLKLPLVNQVVLCEIMLFLSMVAEEEDNLMSPHALSICFAPVLLFSDNPATDLANNKAIVTLLTTMMDHHDEIFRGVMTPQEWLDNETYEDVVVPSLYDPKLEPVTMTFPGCGLVFENGVWSHDKNVLMAGEARMTEENQQLQKAVGRLQLENSILLNLLAEAHDHINVVEAKYVEQAAKLISLKK